MKPTGVRVLDKSLQHAAVLAEGYISDGHFRQTRD